LSGAILQVTHPMLEVYISLSRERLLIINGTPTKDVESTDLYGWFDSSQEGKLELVLENSASEERRIIFEADIYRIG